MKTNIEDWPLNRDFDDLDSAEQKQVRDTLGEELYRAHRELHRNFAMQTKIAPIEPLKSTKDKLDASYKARHQFAMRPAISFRRAMQVAAALLLIATGYSLSLIFSPTVETTPTVREVIRFVDRPVREVEYRTVYVDRPVKVYEQLPTADSLPVEIADNLAVNENQGVSLAADTVLQALMVTLN